MARLVCCKHYSGRLPYAVCPLGISIQALMEIDATDSEKIPEEPQSPDRDMKSAECFNESESMDSTNQISVQMANRRYKLRPRKRSAVEMSAASEEYVHSSKKKKLSNSHNALETIFEEPSVNKNGEVVLLGLSKVKRYISFSEFVTKAKLKKRKSKLKKLMVLKKPDKKLVNENAPMQEVEGKLTMLGI